MSKSWVIILGIGVGFFPWLSGGQDPLAILITYFGLVIAGLLLLRRQEVVTTAGRGVRRLAIALVAWSGLSLIWSVNRFQSEQWLVYLVAAVAAWQLTRMLTDGEQRNLQNLYLLAALLMGAYGLYTYETADYNRLTGSFYWANPAAAFVLPAIVLSIWRYLQTNALKYAALSTYFILIFGLTYSRATTLILGLIGIIALLMSKRLRAYWIKIVFILVAAVLLSTLSSYIRGHAFHHGTINAASRYSAAATGESTSVQDRLIYLQDSLHIWLDHPLLGTGAGTFPTVHPQYQPRVISATTSAHNVYIQTLAELGIVGFLLLVSLVVALLSGVARGVYRDASRWPIALGALGLLMHFGLDIDSRYPALIILLAVLLGSSYRAGKPRPVTAYNAAVLPIVVVLGLGLVISYYQSSSWADRGSAANSQPDFTAAASDYGRAHTGWMYDPDQWTAQGIDYYTLMAISGGAKSYERLALDRANQAIKRDPRDSQHYLLKARTERLGGDLKSADADYLKALALDKYNHPEYYSDLAELKLLEGNTSGAQQVAGEGLALYPDSVVANRSAEAEVPPSVSELYAIRALHELAGGQTADGQKDVAHALQIDPTDSVAIKLQSGDYQVNKLVQP